MISSYLKRVSSTEELPTAEALLRISSGKNRSAQIWAERAHRGQTRGRGSDVPYIIHPAAVATLLAGAGADRDLVCAGWLHDVIEDTDVSFEEIQEEFGERVAELVSSVTKGEAFKRSPLEEHAEMVVEITRSRGAAAMALKAADLTCNLTDLVLDAELIGPAHWAEAFGGRERAERKLSHYLRLSALLQRELASAGVYPGLVSALRSRSLELSEIASENSWRVS